MNKQINDEDYKEAQRLFYLQIFVFVFVPLFICFGLYWGIFELWKQSNEYMLRHAIKKTAEIDLDAAIYLFEITKESIFYMKQISKQPYDYIFFAHGPYYNINQKIWIINEFQKELDAMERFLNHKIKYKDAFKNSR
jgi:hypothetical protein